MLWRYYYNLKGGKVKGENMEIKKALKECKHISLLQHNYIISCAVMQEVKE